MAICYQCDHNGYFVFETDDFGGFLPAGAVYDTPPFEEGMIARWNDESWELVETHKGKTGYLDGKPKTIIEHGPLPVGWSDTPPPPTPEELAQQRIAAIKTELVALDISKVRPLEAIADSSAGKEEQTILAELKAQTDELREEMHILEEMTVPDKTM